MARRRTCISGPLKDTTDAISGVPAGYYALKVMDADSTLAYADITLTEPTAMKIAAEPYKYPNGYNVSCYDCFNGSIDVTVHYGVPPYAYDWGDGVQTEDRSGLGAVKYGVKVTDANGCVIKSETVYMSQPERESWDMGGNASTDPDAHYMGTSDSTDLVLKSNGQERIRLKRNGDIAILGNEPATGLLMRGGGGVLHILRDPMPITPCAMDLFYSPVWLTKGNTFSLCAEPDEAPRLGTRDSWPLDLITMDQLRMRITTSGRVAIGHDDPADQFEVHTAMAHSGIALVNDRTDDNARTGIRFKKGDNERWGLGCDMQGTGGQDFFLKDAQANAIRLMVNSEGKVGIGTVPPGGAIDGYRLFVEDGIATRDVLVKHGAWPDYVFGEGYGLMPLNELRDFLKRHRHLPHIPSAAELDAQGGVALGDITRHLTRTVEEQALYILQLEEKYEALEQRLRALETSTR